MNTHNINEHTLETDPVKVKELANDHFKTIAGIPPSTPPTIDEMSDRWQLAYLPSDEINPTIYKDLLAPPTDEEWKEAIKNLSNNKAAGLSGIPYDLIKQLPEEASLYLKLLITECFDLEEIPSHWKDATIYPIPKPYDWNCYLSNTRPITLLDTARKIMTRIMNKRLSSILAANHVLKGNNYAGLPGSNCSTPIAILESIIQDAKSHNKPLFIFLQDISKAFDSMDVRMLQLAMQRLKIPTGFIKLVTALFTDRYNTVITAYGHSAPYKTKIGIDQGETLSPLLWVIYIDPLLTVLNREASTPYIIDSDPLTPRVSTSTLAFMDDTTLISSSTEGLLHLLDIAQEFYNMNNTKINFNKAELICNRDPTNHTSSITDCPVPYNFKTTTIDFTCTPLSPKSSFRFLGVWFTLALNKQFIKRQCCTEYQLFASKLTKKRLTTDQLKYLHNAVLLPKVLYRLKCTALSEYECNVIMSPFKKLYKNTSSLVSSLPNSFLHYKQALGLTNLFQQHLTNHITNLSNALSAGDSFSRIIQHRLFQIAKDINIPFSPLLLDNFKTFSKTKIMNTNLILRIISFASEIGISFARPLQASQSVDDTLIYTLFDNNSGLYSSSLHMIKRSSIQYLSQCTSADGSVMLPYRDAFKRNSVANPGTRILKWYQHIISHVCHNNSLRIKDEFIRQLAHTNVTSINRPFERPPV